MDYIFVRCWEERHMTARHRVFWITFLTLAALASLFPPVSWGTLGERTMLARTKAAGEIDLNGHSFLLASGV